MAVSRPGSRPWLLRNLKPGERTFFEAPSGEVSRFMQQIHTDVQRVGLTGKVSLTVVLGVVPSSRTVIELVMATRLADE